MVRVLLFSAAALGSQENRLTGAMSCASMHTLHHHPPARFPPTAGNKIGPRRHPWPFLCQLDNLYEFGSVVNILRIFSESAQNRRNQSAAGPSSRQEPSA